MCKCIYRLITLIHFSPSKECLIRVEPELGFLKYKSEKSG